MKKKIALAIDASDQALGAVKYAAELATTLSDLEIELLHIQPALSQYLTDDAQRKPSARAALEKVIEQNEANAHALLDKAAQRLAGKGVDENHIHTMTLQRNTGVANDILVMGQSKSYDAILVGRRGASYLREWVMGSVAANLVSHSQTIPIWVVDGEAGNNKILLAADGSQASLRALDHLAFMLSGPVDKKLHVLHVQPRFQDYCTIDLESETRTRVETAVLEGEKSCMDDFYAQALGILEKNNVEKNRFDLDTSQGSLSVPRTILGYAREHGFGTIVMGRRGRGKSIYTGSVSRSLLYKASDSALWVVP